MPVCPRWSKAFLILALLIPGIAAAQWSTYDEPAEEAQPTAPQSDLSTQPFGAAPVIPPSYTPSYPSADEPPPAPPTENKTKYGPPPQPEPVAEPREPDKRHYISVTLQGLDKVTARRQRFEAQMGTVTSFGNLEIVPKACWQSPEGERPESAALLEIWQWKPGEKPSFVFFGWMFSSSPALSSLEHPIYDISVLQCVEEKKKKRRKGNGVRDTKEKKESSPVTRNP